MAREHTISSRTFTKGALVYTVSRIVDAAYPQDEQFATPQGDDWCYIGIACDIRCQTPANWADGGPVVGRASVWGIESDSDEAYFADTEAEMIAEAEAEVQALLRALGAHAITPAAKAQVPHGR